MAGGFIFLYFSGMHVWPRRMEPTLPEKGFHARESNRAKSAKTDLITKKPAPDSARRTVTRAPSGSNGMHLHTVEPAGDRVRRAVSLSA